MALTLRRTFLLRVNHINNKMRKELFKVDGFLCQWHRYELVRVHIENRRTNFDVDAVMLVEMWEP